MWLTYHFHYSLLSCISLSRWVPPKRAAEMRLPMPLIVQPKILVDLHSDRAHQRPVALTNNYSSFVLYSAPSSPSCLASLLLKVQVGMPLPPCASPIQKTSAFLLWFYIFFSLNHHSSSLSVMQGELMLNVLHQHFELTWTGSGASHYSKSLLFLHIIYSALDLFVIPLMMVFFPVIWCKCTVLECYKYMYKESTYTNLFLRWLCIVFSLQWQDTANCKSVTSHTLIVVMQSILSLINYCHYYSIFVNSEGKQMGYKLHHILSYKHGDF